MDAPKCQIDNRRYSSGEQLCLKKECYVCENGTWQLRFIDRVYGVGP